MAVHFYFEKKVTLKERNRLKKFIEGIFRKEKTGLADLTYIFCGDKQLLGINKQFLRHNYHTDIITFDMSDFPGSPKYGEVYISIDRVKDNAADYGVSGNNELHRVIFHGALHLCGYKDKSANDIKQMRNKEDKYLKDYFRK